MHPATGGRFCDSCAKNVVDFTSMADSQIAKYLLQNKGSICGRVKSTQLQRPLQVEKEVGPTQVKAISWFLRAAVLVGLTLPGKANTIVKTEVVAPNNKLHPTDEPIPRQVTITGTVTDSISGEAILNARLVITGIADTLATDSTGNFTALVNVADSTISEIRITAMAGLYDPQEIVFTIPQSGLLTADIKLKKLIATLPFDWKPDTFTAQPLTWVVGAIVSGGMGIEYLSGDISCRPFAIIDTATGKGKPVFGNKFAGLYKAIKEEEDKPDYYLYLLYMSFAVGGIYLAYKKWFGK